MRTEKEIRKLLDLMEETYRHNTEISETFPPADAYNSADTLKWVLGEESIIPEHFEQNGLNMEEWLLRIASPP